MHRLYTIIVTFKEYFLFTFLITISLVLLSVNDNPQIRAIRSYTIGFVGILQSALSIVPNVFELQRENAILRQQNVNLSDEVSRLREAKLQNTKLRAMLGLKEETPFSMAPADVIGKSLTLMNNTITLNIGEENGVKPDMPVISEAGLVGKVIAVSKHYSLCQLLLHEEFRVSAKTERSRVDGIIAWNGGSVVVLKNVAKTQDVQVGDRVITSEYSNYFPARIGIGTVVSVVEKPGSLLKEILVAPSVDLTMLEQVFVILQTPDSERAALERRAQEKQ
jgi:rod shape-determining protein MreC